MTTGRRRFSARLRLAPKRRQEAKTETKLWRLKQAEQGKRNTGGRDLGALQAHVGGCMSRSMSLNFFTWRRIRFAASLGS